MAQQTQEHRSSSTSHASGFTEKIEEHTAAGTENNESTKLVADDGATAPWNPGYRFYMAFSALAVLAMMVSLDGTSVSVALPICHFTAF